MRSEAQKRADKVYRTKQLANGKNKQINATISANDYLLFDNYCKRIGMSKASTIVNAIKYLIANNVNLAEWVEMEKAENEAEAVHDSND